MDRKNYIATQIEENRIALLRMVFCWLTAALCLKVRGDKPLPRRVGVWVSDLLTTAEKCIGALLVAIHYNGQIKRQRSVLFERAAQRLGCSNRTITLRTLTISGIVKRLKALHYKLHNLRAIALRLARSIAAHARTAAMKATIFAIVASTILLKKTPEDAREKAVPP